VPRDIGIIIRSDSDAGRDAIVRIGRVADEAGAHSVWVTESWGRDAFTLLTLIAATTQRIQLATGIVNVFSRTPATLAQHFATLDEVSDGRSIIGLGASGPAVVENFHGVRFDRPLTRIREYVEILNKLMAGDRTPYAGRLFSMPEPLPLRLTPTRDHIPIYIAALSEKSVAQTARIADGWLPNWTPIGDLAKETAAYGAAVEAAQRSRFQAMVRAPRPIVLTTDVERGLDEAKRTFSFYIARMGDFFAQHMVALGYADAVAAIREGFDRGGARGGAAAVPTDLCLEVSLVTDSVAEVEKRLDRQQEAGVDVHIVDIKGHSEDDTGSLLARLAKGPR
jgi:F420-dependent oxidoreductase-like protein